MNQSDPSHSSSFVPGHPATDGFETTDWSMLAKLDSPDFSVALAKLCQEYWYPVYAFIRRRTTDTHQAEDLTQSFFCKVISLQTFRMADRERGRFRAFLLTSVKNYLATEHQSARTQKRGGDRRALSLDFGVADELYQRNGVASLTPDREFDRAWALSLIEHAIETLQQEYDRLELQNQFELFLPTLRSSKLDYGSVSLSLDMSESASRKAASRFRERYGRQLRKVIAATLGDTESIESEIDWILNVLSYGQSFKRT